MRRRTLALFLLLGHLAPGDALAMSLLPLPGPMASGAADHPFVPPSPVMAERVIVRKAERRLYLMRGGRVIRSYEIALGFKPTGTKRRQGDGRTPEGRYVLDWKHAGSSFHRSLHVSYPNSRDLLRAAFRGDRPGGMIMIHGQPNRRSQPQPIAGDWTQGCIAVSNAAIDEIWDLTAAGTPIEILP